MKKILKKVLGVIQVDEELRNRVEEYISNFYFFCYEEEYLLSNERVPYYFYWEDYKRYGFCAALCFFISIIFTAIKILSSAETHPIFVIAIGAALSICFYMLLASYTPYYYWETKKRFKSVRVIRLNTSKVIARFEHDYERVKILAKPYKERRDKEFAERNAAEEEKRRLEAEAKVRERETLKAKFRPQYIALLQYVETHYQVSTPDPDCYEGYFAIVLPDIESTGGKIERRFAYTSRERGINQLITLMADMDPVMRKRAELCNLVDAATNSPTAGPHIPSDNASI